MGVTAINDVMSYVSSGELKGSLNKSMNENRRIMKDLQSQLNRFHDGGKDPNAMLKSMAWLKTNVRLKMNGSDSVVADLITDGCNMGIKSLNRYLNEYKAADERTKDIARDIIGTEERLAYEIRKFL